MRKINYIKKLNAMKYTKFIVGIIIGLLIAGISIYYASTIYYQSADVGYDNTASGLTSDNVQDALNELSDLCIETEKDFEYTGGVQTYRAPKAGTYLLEVWGAQGGSSTYIGGKGGYSKGNVVLTKGQVLYIVVGGQGSCINSNNKIAGGYNGGGGASVTRGSGFRSCSGGGATHIAKQTGTLAEIGVSNLSNILIVAGGGGGATYRTSEGYSYFNGGAGGGTTGSSSSGTSSWSIVVSTGGSQSSGGTGGSLNGDGGAQSGVFGSAGPYNVNNQLSGGGGGLYGGGSGNDTGGGGGSGYIGGVTSGTMENGVQGGYGKARITILS